MKYKTSMKYIKLFENIDYYKIVLNNLEKHSFNNIEIFNIIEYMKYIPLIHYSEYPFSKFELKKLKDFFNSKNMYINSRKKTGLFHFCIKPEVKSEYDFINIVKYKDDYFFIKIFFPEEEIEYFLKVDQISGLLSFLKNIFNI